ncbi:2'-5' RNA ligase family protein [Mucilaginibacter myungsuensis]|nr:2'-5' RNA ligase family protein [Mucilaginibacter myungsuensis]MDN3598552.1 2'-5' RNA ligase family protein [Mucilaginibacter myungsuensis]
MDEESQAFFDAQRKLNFPPERNYLAAHIMLFHQLPNEAATYHVLTSVNQVPFTLAVTGLMNLGAGVAYRIESEELNLLHRSLSKQFTLIPQDRQGFRPHVTIMNKTTPEAARALIAELSDDFKPFTFRATGLDLWTYLDGPWRFEQHFPFR